VTKAEIFNRYLREVWERGSLSSVGEFFTDDFVSHSGPHDYGLDAVRTDVELFRAHHPNVHFDVLDQFEAAEKLVTRLRVHSAVKTAFAILITRFDGDRIAEDWAVWTGFE
jgi:predicted ester cyclase